MDDMLEDLVTVRRPATGQDAAAGMKRTPFVDLFAEVPAKVEDASAGQSMQYAQLQLQVSHVVYTKQDGIANGHLIATSDDRLLRVNDIRKLRGIGGMDTYYRVGCLEVRPGA